MGTCVRTRAMLCKSGKYRSRLRREVSGKSLEADCAGKFPRIPCAPNASADDPACLRAHTHSLARARERKKHKKNQQHSYAFASGIRHHPELLQDLPEDRPPPSRRSQEQNSVQETLHGERFEDDDLELPEAAFPFEEDGGMTPHVASHIHVGQIHR